MYVIGAVINTSVDGIDEMIEQRDSEELLRLARMQIDYGADMLAINCGSRIDSEPDDIEWMFRTIQDEIEIPLCIDSPNPEAHRIGLEVHRHGRAMVDSITAERHRIEDSLPLIREHNAMVTAIMHDESGMPSDVDDRMRVMPKLDDAIREYGIPSEDVYLDCMVFPLSVNADNGRIYLETLRRVKAEYPQYKTICGLNNVSYGLPQEDILNTSFLAMCAALGQDATFIEITKESGAFIRGISALAGEDEFCMNYISSFRESKLDIFGAEKDT